MTAPPKTPEAGSTGKPPRKAAPLTESEKERVQRVRSRAASPLKPTQIRIKGKRPHATMSFKKEGREHDVNMTVQVEVFGSVSEAFIANQFNRLVAAMYGGRVPDETEVDALLAAMHGLRPQDEAEGMMAAQLVAMNHLSLEFMRRAMWDEQTPEGVERHMNRAIKLLNGFNAKLDALQKYRGKGQQKMTVEHVHVNEGGQAIIGNVGPSPQPGQGGTPQK